MQKGYNIEDAALNERLTNNLNEFGYNLKFKKNNDILKNSIRHRNMTNSIKIKEKK